jgi:hypothetical protein
VEDLPNPASVDYGFAKYHGKMEVTGNALSCHGTLEIREPTLPVSRVNDLKMLYRVIAAEERNTAVRRPATAATKG